jgi:peptide/nickel transport system ATP-binding protein
MYVGHFMELAVTESLFRSPFHPYTEALLSSIPVLDPTAEHERIRLEGDVPSQIDLPGGCPFHPRCPRYIGDICRMETPPWQQTDEGSQIFCHIPVAELESAQTSLGN